MNGPDIDALLRGKTDLENNEAIRQIARAKETEGLGVLLAMGHLGFDVASANVDVSLRGVDGQIGAWAERLKAFVGFSDQMNMVFGRQTHEARPESAHPEAFFKAPLPFKSWFVEASNALAIDYAQVKKRFPATDGAPSASSLSAALTRWVTAACLLDLPETAKSLGSLQEGLVEKPFPINDLGQPVTHMVASMVALQITPVGVAIQFSRERCLDAILPLCMDPTRPLIGTFASTEGDPSPCYSASEARADAQPIHWGSNMQTPNMTLMCSQAMFEKMTTLSMQNAIEKPPVLMGALRSMDPQQDDEIDYYVNALQSAGVYNLDPLAHAQKACIHGYPGVIKGLQGIDWARLLSVTINNAAKAHEKNANDGRSEAICALIDAAVADGHGKTAMAIHAGFTPGGTMPIQEIVAKNMEKVLLKYLDHGAITPTQPLLPGSRSLMDLVHRDNPAMAGLVKAWSARQTMHSLLHDIEKEMEVGKPKP